MNEKFRLFKENGRIVLLIEDASEKDVEIVKNIIGDIMMQDVIGIKPITPKKCNPPAREDTGKESVSPKPVSSEESIPANKPEPQNTDNKSVNNEKKPTIIGGKKHQGKTFREVMSIDPSYIRWMINSNHKQFTWEEFYGNLDVWIKNAEKCSMNSLELMMDSIDARPDRKESVKEMIKDSLGCKSMRELNEELDQQFARETLIEVMNALYSKGE